ncbi:MAG: hypothetical protein U1E83_09325 [Methylotetracoccus sp.]
MESPVHPNGPLRLLSWLGLLAAAGALTYLLYSFGFPGAWTFDDRQNLAGLASVTDVQAARQFVFGNPYGGTIGRPLSMASFLLNRADWPDDPAGFRAINVAMHVVNGLLVAAVAWRVARFVPSLAPRAEGFAIVLAIVWMLQPLLVSTSLMAVQRMTLLAATCSLAGVLAYLQGRDLVGRQPVGAYLWMSGGLLLGTVIGVLAKENAALLPLLVGVLEWSVLSVYAPVRQRSWSFWRALFFGGPVLLLLGYVVWSWKANLAAYEFEPFSLQQRLWSEPVILFAYVRQILLPDIGVMGPLQDDTSRILGPGALPLAAVLGWLVAVAAAVLMRRRWPAFAFAVLFFLAGHLLESTVFPLELYFEHRNYLPSLGPLGAVVATAWSADARWPRPAIGLYAALFALLLWRTAASWGDPAVAAQAWSMAHPTSVRATQNLATAFQERGDYAGVAHVILQHYQRAPTEATLAVQVLVTQCLVADRASYGELMRRVIVDVPRMAFNKDVVTNLSNLVTLIESGQCEVADLRSIERVAGAFLDQPLYARNPGTRYGLSTIRGRLLALAGEDERGIAAMRDAFSVYPSEDLAETIALWLVRTGKAADAVQFVSHAEGVLGTSSHTAERFEDLRARIGKDRSAHVPNASAAAR